MEIIDPSYYPILQYTSVKDVDDGNMKYCTSAEKLERDIISLIEHGYESISLQEYYELVKTTTKECSNTTGAKKVYSLVFLGGYLDNYTNAFPLLKKYNIKASMFVATGLVGLDNYPGITSFIPHFGWEHAQEMVNSGHVNIYPLWHPFDNKANFVEEIKNKKDLIEKYCSNNGSFSIIAKCDIRDFDRVSAAGYDAFLIDALEMDPDILSKGGMPAINVEHIEPVIDIVHKFTYLYDLMLFNHGMRLESENEILTELQLPLTFEPLAKNYLRHTVPLEVIGAFDKQRAERIVLNDYINISYKPSYDELDYDNDIYEYWNCLNCQKISKDVLERNCLAANDYIIRGLNAGYYVDIWLDAYYIPRKYDYQKTHKSHGLFIYGYDLNARQYYCTTYTDRLLYEKIIVPMDAVREATSTNWFTTILLLKNSPNITIPYDIQLLYRRLKNYLQSTVYDDPSLYHKKTVDHFHQYAAVKAFVDHVIKTGVIPNTALYCFAEHKKNMAWRIEYICRQEIIVDNEISAKVELILKNARWLITASVKYTVGHSPKLFNSICETMNNLNKDEVAIISAMLSLLKKKYDWIE